MIGCLVSKGMGSEKCEMSVSGVSRIFFVNFAEWEGVDDPTGALAIYTHKKGQATAVDPVEVVLADNTGYANAPIVSTGSSKCINHQVGGVVGNVWDKDFLGEYKNWILGTFVAIVVQKDGNVVIYGSQNGLTATNFDTASGTAQTDASGLTFLFEGNQTEVPILVGDDTMTVQDKIDIIMNPTVKPSAEQAL